MTCFLTKANISTLILQGLKTQGDIIHSNHQGEAEATIEGF